jgi:GNAT superfamily N-acetyltransferase
MPVREVTSENIEAVWPRLTHLFGETDRASRLLRVREMLKHDGPHCLIAEDEVGIATGLAVTENYRSAWIFEDHIAAIREFIATAATRNELLAAIDARGRSDGVNNLSRFTTADDPLLPWWYEAGFVEYMAAFRRPLDVEEEEATLPVDDGIVIREVADLDADWPKLWPLFEKLNQHHAQLTGRPLNQQREENARSELEKELADGEALVMLAEVDGKAIATSSAELGERHSDGSRTGFRSKLYVEEAYRRRELAARFEARALPWFREHGVTDVERWIVAGNERPWQIWSARGYRPERLLLRKALQP